MVMARLALRAFHQTFGQHVRIKALVVKPVQDVLEEAYSTPSYTSLKFKILCFSPSHRAPGHPQLLIAVQARCASQLCILSSLLPPLSSYYCCPCSQVLYLLQMSIRGRLCKPQFTDNSHSSCTSEEIKLAIIPLRLRPRGRRNSSHDMIFKQIPNRHSPIQTTFMQASGNTI